MLRITKIIVLFGALGTIFSFSANAQTNASLPQIFGGKQYDENKIYQDENGTYRYETREKRVWVPEQETTGIFGKRIEPGHYETVREQVKIYLNRNKQNGSNGGYYDQNGVYHPDNGVYTNGKQPGWAGKHPHGMPPGQRKKMSKNNPNNSQYESNRKNKNSQEREDNDD